MDTIERPSMSYIRRVTEADIPWLHDLCARAYPKGYFNPEDAEKWVRYMIANAMLDSSTHLVLRGDRSWLVAFVQSLPWNMAQKVARLLPVSSLGSARREIEEMVRIAVDWARKKGAGEFHFATITGVDLGPIVLPLGAKPSSPAYVLRL
jgi:hypothetical protein